MSRPAATAPRLHPNLAEVYRQRVANLQSALAGPDGTEALERLRALIEKVVLHPASEGRGFQVELTGQSSRCCASARLTNGGTQPLIVVCSRVR